jgi:hypothetical protein
VYTISTAGGWRELPSSAPLGLQFASHPSRFSVSLGPQAARVTLIDACLLPVDNVNRHYLAEGRFPQEGLIMGMGKWGGGGAIDMLCKRIGGYMYR